MKVIMTKGLPASGKSTWAKEQVSKGNWKRINKDDLREMLDNSKWSKDNEKFVIHTRDHLLYLALQEGYSVIIDDTNLAPKHEQRIRDLVNTWNKNKNDNVEFSVKDFTDVSLEECIKRDTNRAKSVGEKVIRGMYKQFLKPSPIYHSSDGAPKAVICDLDGTLAKMVDRGPFEWMRVGEDEINTTVGSILDHFHNNHYKVIIMSGRDSVCREITENWLSNAGIKYDLLLMRPEGDTRKDSIVKRELFDNHIMGNYNIEVVFDDRNQVVEMWRDLGLVCYQVAEGDF